MICLIGNSNHWWSWNVVVSQHVVPKITLKIAKLQRRQLANLGLADRPKTVFVNVWRGYMWNSNLIQIRNSALIRVWIHWKDLRDCRCWNMLQQKPVCGTQQIEPCLLRQRDRLHPLYILCHFYHCNWIPPSVISVPLLVTTLSLISCCSSSPSLAFSPSTAKRCNTQRHPVF